MNEKQPLKNAIQDRFDDISLDEEQLAALRQPVYHAPAGRPVRGSWLLAGGLFAAALTLISFFYTAQWYRAGGDEDPDDLRHTLEAAGPTRRFKPRDDKKHRKNRTHVTP